MQPVTRLRRIECSVGHRRLGRCHVAAAEHPGEGVQDRGRQQERAVSRQQREVLEHAAHHRTEEVGGERRGRVGCVPEPGGEHQVRDEHGCERQGARHQETRDHREHEQPIHRNHAGDRERHEEERVEPSSSLDVRAPLDLDGEQDRQQDPGEHEGVHEPRGSEQQREADDVLRLEQQEGRTHEEEVDGAGHPPEGTAGDAHRHRRDQEDERDDRHVLERDGPDTQVHERPVVGRGLRHDPLPGRPPRGAVQTLGILADRHRRESATLGAVGIELGGVEARRRAERALQRGGQAIHEPVHPVVVVDGEHTARLQVLAHGLERLFGEEVALEPDRRLSTHERQGIGEGEENQVVLLLGALQERPTIVRDAADARILVRVVGMELCTELLELRIDVHGVDVAGALQERDRDVATAAGPRSGHHRARSVPACS